jgi:hypothetical protein
MLEQEADSCAAVGPTKRDGHGKHAAATSSRILQAWSRRVSNTLVASCILGASLVGIGLSAAVSSATSAAAPLAPTSVTMTQVGQLPDLRINWAPSASGTPATGATVQLYSVSNQQLANATYAGEVECEASCTTAIFRQLSFNQLYVALIWPNNSVGTGSAAATPVVEATNTCPVGACVTVNASQTIGTANHADSGLLDSLFPVGNDLADLSSLDTSMYRGSPSYNSNGTFNWTSWNEAVKGGTQTTLVLSNLWSGYYGGNPSTPWSNWTTYTNWVTATVKAVLANGVQVNYWEPYNEPGGQGYYSAANFATVTPALLLQQFLVTYKAIKAADPKAAIIGPSLSVWEDFPNQYGSTLKEPDMVTFLNYAVTNNMKLAAISWHEINDSVGPNPTEDSLTPTNLEDDVAEARALIAARPSLGSPQIFINEYGMPEVQIIPGWDVGYLSALTAAGVNSAVRACWGAACAIPSFDGLLDTSGTIPQNDYWVRQAYAAMSGNMVSVTSDSDDVTGLASFNSSKGQLTGLVGRAAGCTQDPWCAASWPTSTDAAPTSVNITVTVPWASGQANVSLSDIPGSTLGNTPAPIPVVSMTAITPTGSGTGTLTISVPSFADGDAYSFTVTKAA